MIDKEKVRELVIALSKFDVQDYAVGFAKEWLEQNLPLPQVVGLSGEQKEQVVSTMFDFLPMDLKTTDIKYAMLLELTKYLATKTFAQVKEVPVGLSDAQLESLHTARYKDYLSLADFVNNYQQWAKNQTFERSEVTKLEKEIAEMQIAYIDLQRYCSEIKKELEQLKSQQLKPNWDDAPEFANWLAQDKDGMWNWYESEPKLGGENWYTKTGVLSESALIDFDDWQQTLEQRPQPPAPTVDVGQVWKSDVEEVRVIEFGRRDNKQTVCFKDVNTDCIKQLTTSYFLEKFEMVS